MTGAQLCACFIKWETIKCDPVYAVRADDEEEVKSERTMREDRHPLTDLSNEQSSEGPPPREEGSSPGKDNSDVASTYFNERIPVPQDTSVGVG